MRIPKVKVYDTTSETEVVELGAMNYPSHWYNFNNTKDKDKWIKTVERMVRGSMEYRDLVLFLKTVKGMHKCSFFHKVSKPDFGKKVKISIELHHEPFTLYDIVAVILNKQIMEDKIPDMFDTVNEVLSLHYRGLVGLVPLSETAHQAVHSGKVIIPLQMIDEGYNQFIDEYSSSIKEMPELLHVLAAKLELSKEYEKNPEKFVSALAKKYIYVVNTEYASIPEEIA